MADDQGSELPIGDKVKLAAHADESLRPQPMTSEGFQRFKAALLEHHVIEPCRVLYVQTSNPIHAFAAYRAARVAKLDIPDWILELLDEWAEALWVKRPKGAKAMAEALGLATKGGPSIMAQAETQARNLEIAQRVFQLRERDPDHDTMGVFLDVADEFNLSAERVQGIWYELTSGLSL